jgi:hypothetical protein
LAQPSHMLPHPLTTRADVRENRAPSLSWSVEEQSARFVVRYGDGQVFADVYFEGEPDRRSVAKLPTKHEARRLASHFAKLPELLGASLVPTEVGEAGRLTSLPRIYNSVE